MEIPFFDLTSSGCCVFYSFTQSLFNYNFVDEFSQEALKYPKNMRITFRK